MRRRQVAHLQFPAEPLDKDCLLTTEQAARMLAVRPATLKYWRVRSHREGPGFIKLGGRHKARVRYALSELRRFVENGKVKPSGDLKK